MASSLYNDEPEKHYALVYAHKPNANAKVNHIIEYKDHLFPYTAPIYSGL